MLLHIRQLLSADEVTKAGQLLVDAPWQAGNRSAGPQAAQVKRNAQLPESCAQALALRQLVLAGLERSAQFFSAALPKTISPPMFNRYAGDANHYGNHVDAAVRFLPDGKGRVRTDVSCTVFLSDPAQYDGGELVMEGSFGPQRIKFAAGDAVLYPGTTVHRVDPVTRGERLASFFWIQSMVRSDEQRSMLYDMDQHLMALRQSVGENDPAIVGLTGTYHNLLRMWADV